MYEMIGHDTSYPGFSNLPTGRHPWQGDHSRGKCARVTHFAHRMTFFTLVLK